VTLRAEEDSLLDARRRAAAALTARVKDRLEALALAHARFEVRVEGPAGEQVLFLFAARAPSSRRRSPTSRAAGS